MRRLLLATVAAVLLIPPSAQAAQFDTVFLARTTAGVASDSNSTEPTTSADGRFVAFVSEADNLSTENNDTHAAVYLRDRVLGITTYVSRGPADRRARPTTTRASVGLRRWALRRVRVRRQQPERRGQRPDLEHLRPRRPDRDDAADLARGRAGWRRRGRDVAEPVYLRRRHARGVRVDRRQREQRGRRPARRTSTCATFPEAENILVSRADGASGAAGTDASLEPSLSADGDHVAFTSIADNLSTEDSDSQTSVLVRDIRAGDTEFISRANGATATPPRRAGGSRPSTATGAAWRSSRRPTTSRRRRSPAGSPTSSCATGARTPPRSCLASRVRPAPRATHPPATHRSPVTVRSWRSSRRATTCRWKTATRPRTCSRATCALRRRRSSGRASGATGAAQTNTSADASVVR